MAATADRMPRLPLICLALAAVLATGCGKDAPAPEQAAAPAPAPAAPVLTPVEIEAPKAGRRVRLSRTDPAVEVSGTAAPGELLSVYCGPPPCQASAITAQDGTWAASLPITAKISARNRATVTARYTGTSDPELAARVTVRLRRPSPPPAAGARTQQARDAEPTSPQDAGADLDPTLDPELPAQTVPDAAPADGAGRQAVVVGDSLARGTEPFLAGFLPGWQVRTNARVGRPLAEGMRILARTPRPSPTSVAVLSLFTNNDPGATRELAAAVAQSLAWAGPQGCAVWATIVRPPKGGRSYADANRLLEQLAAQDPRLQVVPWARAVAASPSLVGRDGVHAGAAGYRVRAQLYAEAARSCP